MNPAMRQFYIASMVVFLCYGIAAQRYQIFPAPQLHWVYSQAKLALGIFDIDRKWYYVDAPQRKTIGVNKPEQVQPGLTMLTGVAEDHMLRIKVVDNLGEQVHKWDLDWYDVWPDATHIPEKRIPRGKPGTHIHGSKLMDNGDIVFNYENLGLVRIDMCGNTVFRLPYPTHHSIHVAEDGNIWVPGQVNYTKRHPDYPSFEPPFKDDTIATVSPQGELLNAVSIMDLLSDNGYMGMMFMSSLSSRNPRPTGDLFHLNDVEVFPTTLPEGVFKHGDVMVSLRNINAVFVYDPKTLKIRFFTSGRFVRQHDPDFVDGNTISVYDNNHIPKAKNPSSKIVYVSAIDGSVTTDFAGSEQVPFYSKIMGKHQRLENGNLLVLESLNGRAIELNREKVPVWSYNNLIEGAGKVGIMEGAERLEARFDKAFFQQKLEKCSS